MNVQGGESRDPALIGAPNTFLESPGLLVALPRDVKRAEHHGGPGIGRRLENVPQNERAGVAVRTANVGERGCTAGQDPCEDERAETLTKVTHFHFSFVLERRGSSRRPGVRPSARPGYGS